MKVSVQSLHFHADGKLVEFIEKKLSRLSRYFDRPVEAEVQLKLQDTGSKVHEKITEIHLRVPGTWLVDRKTDKTFEAAVNSSIETLKRQITRHKEKLVDNHHRGLKTKI